MLIRKIVSSFLAICLFTANVYAANLPPADGYDLNADNVITQNYSKDSSRVMAVDAYAYSSTSFKTGVYLKNGALFPVRKSLSPSMQDAVHSRVSTSDPNLYKVTYQMITKDGETRQGIPFVGNISKIAVKFTVKENNDFYFYIAGDGTNSYSASGTLYYKMQYED